VLAHTDDVNPCVSQLSRPSPGNLLRRCLYLVRRYRFQEMVAADPRAAMGYLQCQLAAVVDQNDSQETEEVGGPGMLGSVARECWVVWPGNAG